MNTSTKNIESYYRYCHKQTTDLFSAYLIVGGWEAERNQSGTLTLTNP